MIEYKKKKVKKDYPHTFICDCCEKRLSVKDIECQETLSIDHIGGYSSIFGDGSRVQCDLCQECVKQLLGDYLRIDDPES